MKIAVVTDDFPRISELFIATQVAGLIDKGHDVHIYSFGAGQTPHHPLVEQYDLIRRTSYMPISTRYIDMLKQILRFKQRFPFSGILGYCLRAKLHHETINQSLLWMGLTLSKEDYDVIHVHFGYNAQPVATLREWGILRKPKLVVTFHGCDFLPVINTAGMYDQLFKQADKLIHVTEFAKENALSQGFPKAKISIVPCGLAPEYTKLSNSKKADNQPLRLAFVGRLIDLKKPLNVVEVCKELRNKGINFTCKMIGDGEQMQPCQQLIDHYGLNGSVQMLGACLSDTVVETLCESDIFIFPGGHDPSGRTENQGCVAQEAMATGCIVICTDAGGTHECVVHQQNGFVVHEGDINAMVEHIQWLDIHRNMMYIMSQNAQAHALKNYSNKAIIPKLERTYEN